MFSPPADDITHAAASITQAYGSPPCLLALAQTCTLRLLGEPSNLNTAMMAVKLLAPVD